MATILLIEDSLHDATHIQSHLEDHDVIHATDGWAGLAAACGKNRPDLVITDLELPEVNGNYIASIVQNSALSPLKNIPVFVITNSSSAFDAAFARLEGVTLVRKPFDEQDMQRVKDLLNEQ